MFVMNIKTITTLSMAVTFNTAFAASFADNINFNEAAFPTSETAFSGSQSYNVLDDATGTKLVALNGDLDDITIAVSSMGGGSFDYRTVASGSYRLNHGFNSAPASNNTGDRIVNQLTLTFGSHLSVTDFSFDVSSANSKGVAWEVSIFELLDSSGNVFTATPTINPYVSHTEIDGLSGQGTYVMDRKDTVTGVGTDQTSGVSSHPNENFTVTGDLDYSDFGLAAGTEITGIRMTTILEDVRGVNNGNTNFSSSLIDFTFSGEINSIPEPSSTALLGLGGLALILRRRK